MTIFVRLTIILLSLAPKWRNWQTRRIQNPVRLTPGEGPTPSFGTVVWIILSEEAFLHEKFGPAYAEWWVGRQQHLQQSHSVTVDARRGGFETRPYP